MLAIIASVAFTAALHDLDNGLPKSPSLPCKAINTKQKSGAAYQWKVDGKVYWFHKLTTLTAAYKADFNGDGKKEIIAVGGRPSHLYKDTYGVDLPAIFVLKGDHAKQTWQAVGISIDIGYTGIKDLDDDGTPEIVIQTQGVSWMPFTVIKLPGNELAGNVLYFGDLIRIEDLDGDGKFEILDNDRISNVEGEPWFEKLRPAEMDSTKDVITTYALRKGKYVPVAVRSAD